MDEEYNNITTDVITGEELVINLESSATTYTVENNDIDYWIPINFDFMNVYPCNGPIYPINFDYFTGTITIGNKKMNFFQKLLYFFNLNNK